MNKNILLAVLILAGALLAVNFYLMRTPAIAPTLDTATPSADERRAQKPDARLSPPTVAHRQQPQADTPDTAGKTQNKQPKRDYKHDTSWQKPDYQPTEVEQAREAILASMTPEEQRQTRADLFQMSLYYRNPADVDKAIEAARAKGHKDVAERLERFRRVAFPDN